jgi:hypothetical protein
MGCSFDASIDMWSLGCVLAELVTGRELFPGSTAAEVLHSHGQTLGALPPHLFTSGLLYRARAHLCSPADDTLKSVGLAVSSAALGRALRSRAHPSSHAGICIQEAFAFVFEVADQGRSLLEVISMQGNKLLYLTRRALRWTQFSECLAGTRSCTSGDARAGACTRVYAAAVSICRVGWSTESWAEADQWRSTHECNCD